MDALLSDDARNKEMGVALLSDAAGTALDTAVLARSGAVRRHGRTHRAYRHQYVSYRHGYQGNYE